MDKNENHNLPQPWGGQTLWAITRQCALGGPRQFIPLFLYNVEFKKPPHPLAITLNGQHC